MDEEQGSDGTTPPTPQPQPRVLLNEKGGSKCQHRLCPLGEKGAPFFPSARCYLEECGKDIHFQCYKHLVLQKNAMEHPFPNLPDIVFCTKKHLGKSRKILEGREVGNNLNIQWEKDSKDGPDNPNNSMAILMDWITTHGNYEKYKGDTANGKTKIRIANDIAKRINSFNVRKERTGKAVISKIDNLIGAYKLASDWANQTGAGVLETEGEEPFKAAVSRRHCCCCFLSHSDTIIESLLLLLLKGPSSLSVFL